MSNTMSKKTVELVIYRLCDVAGRLLKILEFDQNVSPQRFHVLALR